MGVFYKTAWYLNHRIRKAMEEGFGGQLTGTLQIDETYVGGRYDKRRKRVKYDKASRFIITTRWLDNRNCHRNNGCASTRRWVSRFLRASRSGRAQDLTQRESLAGTVDPRRYGDRACGTTATCPTLSTACCTCTR